MIKTTQYQKDEVVCRFLMMTLAAADSPHFSSICSNPRTSPEISTLDDEAFDDDPLDNDVHDDDDNDDVHDDDDNNDANHDDDHNDGEL